MLISGEHAIWNVHIDLLRREARQRFFLSPAAQKMATNINRAMRQIGVPASVAVERMAKSLAALGNATAR